MISNQQHICDQWAFMAFYKIILLIDHHRAMFYVTKELQVSHGLLKNYLVLVISLKFNVLFAYYNYNPAKYYKHVQ